MPAPARLPRLLNKPRFFEDLGYEPHPGQAEVHRSAAPRRIVACGVRWGKTMCAAMEGLAAAMEPIERSIGWVVAPTYDLADRVFREIVFTAVGKFKHRVVSLRESERKLFVRPVNTSRTLRGLPHFRMAALTEKQIRFDLGAYIRRSGGTPLPLFAASVICPRFATGLSFKTVSRPDGGNPQVRFELGAGQ